MVYCTKVTKMAYYIFSITFMLSNLSMLASALFLMNLHNIPLNTQLLTSEANEKGSTFSSYLKM